MMGSSEKWSSMVVVVVAAVVVVVLMSALPASAEGADNYMTPCLEKILNCSNNANYTKLVDDPKGELPCCSVWADQAENERECFCNTFVQPTGVSDPFNVTGSLQGVFTTCKINLSVNTMCDGVSKKEGGGNGSNKSNGATKIPLGGLIPSAVILIWTTMLAI